MIIEVDAYFKKQCVRVTYDTDHHTGGTFLNELEIMFKRKGLYFKNNGQPIMPERLESMMLKAAEFNCLSQVFDRFEIIEDEEGDMVLHLQLDVLPEQMFQMYQLSPAQIIPAPHHHSKRLSNVAKQKAPRVCTEHMAQLTGLPLGAFITASAAKLLPSPQKKLWFKFQEEIAHDSNMEPAKANSSLSKYYSQSNKQIAIQQQQGDWTQGVTKHFYDAATEWSAKYRDIFLAGVDDYSQINDREIDFEAELGKYGLKLLEGADDNEADDEEEEDDDEEVDCDDKDDADYPDRKLVITSGKQLFDFADFGKTKNGFKRLLPSLRGKGRGKRGRPRK